ncbi:hypothetical protein EDC01DRAFT_651650 [Geopyxis carbonaria]|nr:hypothetical protein EDC01DRAFT_651650 [Geopyxis carbonaria]
MPYPHALPTTSPVSFNTYYTSPVYPTLPLLLSQNRGSLRNLLKAHKRLPVSSQQAHLPQLLAAVESYIPYLLFLQQSLHSGDVLPSDAAPDALKASWRSTLTSPPFPGAEQRRVDREGLDYEVGFVLSTLAYIHTLLARTWIQDALAPRITAEKKQSLLNTAIQHLLTSTGIFTYSVSLPRAPTPEISFPLDLSPTVLSALSSLSLSDASLLAVTKQDPYPSYLALTSATSTSKSVDSSYLYAPTPPPTGVRALLLSRICIAASAHAENALGLLASCPKRRLPSTSSAEELSPDLPRYIENLQKVARAKACRFLGIDAEASGRVGEGIGWLVLAREILGTSASTSSTPSKFRREFSERKERSALERGDGTWGLDAGKMEETRVLEGLEKNWRSSNDKIFFQLISGTAELAARIPSGREVHVVRPWEPERLDNETVRSLRGSLLESESGQEGWAEDDSEDETSKDQNVSRTPSAGPSVGGYY